VKFKQTDTVECSSLKWPPPYTAVKYIDFGGRGELIGLLVSVLTLLLTERADDSLQAKTCILKD
jgi:hypothetical protein